MMGELIARAVIADFFDFIRPRDGHMLFDKGYMGVGRTFFNGARFKWCFLRKILIDLISSLTLFIGKV